MLIQASQSELSGLDLSLKPPKWARKAAANVGRAVLKAAPIVTTAAMFIPGVGTAVGAAGKALIGAARVLPGATTAIRVGTAAANATKALQATRTAKAVTAAIAVSKLLPKRPSAPAPIGPTMSPPDGTSADLPGVRLPGARLPRRPRTLPLPFGSPVFPVGTGVSPGSNPILWNTPPPVTDAPRIKPVSAPVDPGSNPISLVPDERIQQLQDAARRIVQTPTNGMPTNAMPPSPSADAYAVGAGSSGGSSMIAAPGTDTTPAQQFPWLPVVGVGVGLYLLANGKKRSHR